MVTADEIGSIAIFAGLSEADRERLARAAADLTLAPGEYAAHEGADRALFAVLDGRIEAVKLVDGIPRVVGERQVGELFGEVPIALGTFFPVGFRAGSERTRVLRIEPNDYHAVASVQPDIAKEVGRLAADRMSGPRGLQGIAPTRRRRARSWSGTASIRTAPTCGTSSTATRSASGGSPPMRPTPPRSGAASCRRPTTARRSG